MPVPFSLLGVFGGGDKGVLEVLKYEMNSIEANKLDMNVTTFEKKQAEYPGGAKKYAENKKKADALDMSVETYDKKQAEYPGGAKQYAADKKKADENSLLRYYFNIFYVGITRAQRHILVVEDDDISVFKDFFTY